MKKLLLVVGLLALVGCGHRQSYRLSPVNNQIRDVTFRPQHDSFLDNFEESWTKSTADYERLYEEAVQLRSQYNRVLNDQQSVFATLTDDQLTICQAYLESRRNRPLDPKTLVLLRAVKKNLSAESVCSPESNPALPSPNKYVLLVAIWDAGSQIEHRQPEVIRDLYRVLARQDQLREDAARYMETLQGNIDKSVAVYQRLQRENRDINREEVLRNIEYELRGINISLEGH